MLSEESNDAAEAAATEIDLEAQALNQRIFAEYEIFESLRKRPTLVRLAPNINARLFGIRFRVIFSRELRIVQPSYASDSRLHSIR